MPSVRSSGNRLPQAVNNSSALPRAIATDRRRRLTPADVAPGKKLKGIVV